MFSVPIWIFSTKNVESRQFLVLFFFFFFVFFFFFFSLWFFWLVSDIKHFYVINSLLWLFLYFLCRPNVQCSFIFLLNSSSIFHEFAHVGCFAFIILIASYPFEEIILFAFKAGNVQNSFTSLDHLHHFYLLIS